jgi:DNA-binding XRE family transcriptional regulator
LSHQRVSALAGTRCAFTGGSAMARTPITDRDEKTFLVELGANIMWSRKHYDLTQEQLAKKAKLSRSYLAELERGRVNVSILVVRRLALILNMPLEIWMQ